MSQAIGSMRHRWRLLSWLGAACVVGTAGSARAVDHNNLEEGLPVEVTDAYPLEYTGREVQSRLQYRYTPDGEHEAWLEPRFEVGFPYNMQLALRVPLVTSFADQDAEFRLARIGLEALYNLNQETLTLPAFALVAGVEAPDSRDGGSFDPFGRVILTKSIPKTKLWQRVHVNALLQANVARKQQEGERALRYLLALGYDVRLTATTIGVIDAVRDRPLVDEPARNLGEVGVRIQVTPLVAIALGGGAGATDDGDFLARGTAGFQWFAF